MANIKKYNCAQICSERGLEYISEQNPYVYFRDWNGFTHRVNRVVFGKSNHTGTVKTVQGDVSLFFVSRLKDKFPEIVNHLDFRDFIYNGAQKYSYVECIKHGKFRTKPNWLLTRGSNCMECGRESIKDSLRIDSEEFIKRAKQRYGEEYDYSETEYKGCRDLVDVMCRMHGKFSVMAYVHLQGTGCPDCTHAGGYSRSEYSRMCKNGSNVYFIKLSNGDDVFYKIGISKSLDTRIASISKESGYFVTPVYVSKFTNAEDAWDFEKLLHREFKDYKTEGVPKFRGSTECFRDIPVNEVLKIMRCFS